MCPPPSESTTPNAEFWSSTEYAGFGRALAEELTARGLTTASRFELTQAAYWAARGRLARLKLRATAYGIYPLRLYFRVRRAPAGRVTVVCTNTFYAPMVALAAAPRGTPVVHWVLDLFPEVLTLAGKLRPGGWGERRLRSLVRWTFDRAAANVFLGPHLLAFAEAQFGPIRRAAVIPVGANGAPFRGHAPQSGEGAVEILYSGNLGRMHDVATVAAVLGSPLPAGVRFSFRGNGPGYRELAAMPIVRPGSGREGPPVCLGDNLPEAAWVPAMLAAEVALVTMRPGAEGIVMPSKTYSAMVAGQAILAVCPERSDLADTVRRHDCGWVVAPGDVAGLRQVLTLIAGDRDLVLSKRRAAYAAGHRYYDQPAIAEQWETVLRRVAAEAKPRGA